MTSTVGLVLGDGFQDRRSQLVNRPRNLLLADHGRWCDQQVVSGEAVDASLHGIEEQSALDRGLAYSARYVQFWGERPFAAFFGYEFDSPQEAHAANVADGVQVLQTCQRGCESCGRSSGDLGIRGSNQFLLTTHNPYVLMSIIEKTPQADLAIYVTRMKNYRTEIRLLTEAEMGEALELSMDLFLNLDRYFTD